MNNTEAILEDMRKITILTGQISTIHEKNLKTWVFVAFDGVENLEIKYDLSKDYQKETGEGYVNFYLKLEENANIDNLKERCDKITSWVREMFWNNISTTFFIDGERSYFNSTKKLEARKSDGLE